MDVSNFVVLSGRDLDLFLGDGFTADGYKGGRGADVFGRDLNREELDSSECQPKTLHLPAHINLPLLRAPKFPKSQNVNF